MTNPNLKIIFKYSNIILKACSDTPYLCALRGESCSISYIFLSNEKLLNSPLQVLCKLFKVAISSTTKADLVALFITSK